jgi:hypothetical protein
MFSLASIISMSSTVSTVTDVTNLLFTCDIVAIAHFFLAVKDVLADEKVIIGCKQDICGTDWSIISSSVLLSLMDELLCLFWEANPMLTEEGACGLASGVEDAGGGLFLSACQE